MNFLEEFCPEEMMEVMLDNGVSAKRMGKFCQILEYQSKE